MRVMFFATAATALALASTGTQAQDAPWNGAYVGAHAGWNGRADNDDEETIAFDANRDGTYGDTVNTAAGSNAFSPGFCNGATASSSPADGCTDDDDGFEFGARAGYDWQLGSFVVGALVEAARTDVSDSVTAYSTEPAYYTMNRKLKGLGAVRARAGYAMGNTLIYATGGGAIGQLKHSFNTSNTANTFTTVEDDDSVKGYQLGLGAERKITPDVSLGLEYLYTNLKDDEYAVNAAGPVVATNPFLQGGAGGTDMRRMNEDFEVHSVRLTAAYRF